MSTINILRMFLLMSLQLLNATFQSTITYKLTVPAESTWGIFQSDTIAGQQLSQSASISSLQKCTINNNQGKSGVLQGTLNQIQIVPSLPQGVTYYNPLSIINSIQPCLLETFIPNSSVLTPSCQSPEVMMIDNSEKIPSSSSSSSSTPLTQRYAALQNLNNEVFLQEYQSLYATLESQVAQFLAIKQNVPINSDFYSPLYLKFAALYGDQFVDQTALEKACTTLFGSNFDVSSYFKDSIFPVSCDLTVSNFNGTSSAALTSTTVSSSSGSLSRLVGSSSLSSLFSTVSWANASSFSQLFNSSGAVQNMVYQRARITEVFFLYLGMLLASNIVAGAQTYDQSYCQDSSCPGNSWCSLPAPCQKVNTMPFTFYALSSYECYAQLCSKLAAAARYVALLHDTTSKKYYVQPIDTFYGMVVINQSSYTLISNDSIIAPGKIGILKTAPGVDVWDPAGINPDSQYKYRAVVGTLMKNNQSSSFELKVEENFDEATFDPSKIFVPAIKLCNGITQTQRDIVAKPYLENFFKVDPAVGWAPVVQVVDSQATQVILNMVGIARLNPYDFPLVYRSSELNTLSVGAFSAHQLWQAPFTLYTKIVASVPQNSAWTLCSTESTTFNPVGNVSLTPFTIKAPNSTTTKTITPDTINPYYVAYVSALQMNLNTQISMQDLLKTTIDSIKKSYFTNDDLQQNTLLSLVTKASQNPHDTIIQIVTTQDYRLIT